MLIALYLQDPSLYDKRNYKVGNTICVMYAKQRTFLDGQVGVRVENGHNIKGMSSYDRVNVALPCSLHTLLKLGDSFAKNGNSAVCKVCAKPASHSCSRCKTKYCSTVSTPSL